MTALWDATLASRVQPRGTVLAYAIAQAASGVPVRVAAPSILEIAYGYQRMSSADARYDNLLAWLASLLSRDVLTIVAFDGRAALVAGRLRGVMPHPPARRDRRSKTMRQASWLLDIEIAATAFAAGLDVATDNLDDFEVLRDALAELFPLAPPMAVIAGPC